MNAPAVLDPKVQYLAEALVQGLAPALNANSDALLQGMQNICQKFAEAMGNVSTGAALNGGAIPNKVCKIGGKCGGDCDDCQHATKNTAALMLGARGDEWTTLVTYMQGRGCGIICRPLNPCFVWALQVMLTRVSLRRMYWMLERDDDSVELSEYVATGADYVNVLTTPMGSNKKSILAGSAQQLLPFIPAVTKLTANWTGTSIATKVKVTLYQGPKGLTGLTAESLAAQCVPLGQTKNLTRWFCAAPNGTDGNCFVRPFPPFLGCSGSIVPDTETIYLLLETANLDDTELNGFSFEVIKAGTVDSKKWCKTCEVPTDTWGMPISLGPFA